jgi:hypothetical protein
MPKKRRRIDALNRAEHEYHQYYERVHRAASKAIRGAIHRRYQQRLAEKLRGKFGGTARDRMHRAQAAIGLYTDEIFGGELTMDEAMGINQSNIGKFIEAAQRRDEGREDGRTGSALLQALAVGIGEVTVAKIIQNSGNRVPRSKWLLSHKGMLKQGTAAADAQTFDADRADIERFRQMRTSRFRRPLKSRHGEQ